ncbi:hypothetical protein [Runella slithyformis]|uniref:hypothetical protein n=1 Tax=Runella slithyformis TaxID=106 RepID=UPI00146B643C|nr:hypothetical protein [Runella slithyformis]
MKQLTEIAADSSMQAFQSLFILNLRVFCSLFSKQYISQLFSYEKSPESLISADSCRTIAGYNFQKVRLSRHRFWGTDLGKYDYSVNLPRFWKILVDHKTSFDLTALCSH